MTARSSRPTPSRLGALALAATLVAGLPAATPARATVDSLGDCMSDDNQRRIKGCSELIERPGLDPSAKSLAHAMRALALALGGNYTGALDDYDIAVKLDPSSSVAFNNRAWVLFKLRRFDEGMVDVERAIDLSPQSAHAYDTRAHLRQAIGRLATALADYERAMRFGGARIIRLYQCGLQAQGHFLGRVDGIYSRELRRALEDCVRDEKCDPLPPDEECRSATS